MPNKTVHHRVYSVLTIAGSDSGAASGIQADLKTFAAFGIHGVSAITAITAQNIRTLGSVQVLSADQVTAQLHTLSADFDIKAVKIGMLGSRANVIAVAAWLQDLRSHRGSRPAVLQRRCLKRPTARRLAIALRFASMSARSRSESM